VKKLVDLVVQRIFELVGTYIRGRFWRSKVGNLSKDVFETVVVCHVLGNTLHKVGISA